MACITGFTSGGYYYFTDCCGLVQAGISPGLENVCISASTSASTIGVILDSGSTCTQNCNQGPLSYVFTVTGLCDNPYGIVTIQSFGGIPPYTIDNITPGSLSAQTSSSDITFTGLTGGTYVFRLNDSLGIQNNELFINVEISDCFVASITNTNGTTCGDSNGTFTINATSTAAPYDLIVYKNNTIFSTYQVNSLPYTLVGLDEGIYFSVVYDYGMVSAITDNVVVSGSSGTTFGLWKVNTSECVPNSGKLSVTGLTGNGPYSFLWSNGETTQMVTGLTVGSYTVTVTDFYGCETSQTETVGVANPLGVGLITSVNPSCFNSDGSVTVTITGGTAPYTISANTGYQSFTLSNTFTVPNLPTGAYYVYWFLYKLFHHLLDSKFYH